MKNVVFIALICMASAESFKQKIYNQFIGSADVATVADLTNNGEAIKVDSCEGDGDALKVRSIKFDVEKFTLTVTGDLQRQLMGGNVSAKISLGQAPEDATWKEKMSRFAGFHMKKHNLYEPLCDHLARGLRRHDETMSSCPIQTGAQTLHFSLHRLPNTVAAGEYKFLVKAVDEVGGVVCLDGKFLVQRGATGQFFRRVQEATVSSAHALFAGLLPLLLMTSAHM